jgi:hypothetical protein
MMAFLVHEKPASQSDYQLLSLQAFAAFTVHHQGLRERKERHSQYETRGKGSTIRKTRREQHMSLEANKALVRRYFEDAPTIRMRVMRFLHQFSISHHPTCVHFWHQHFPHCRWQDRRGLGHI